MIRSGDPSSMHFVEMERMVHRPDFEHQGRCNGNEQHEIFIAVKQLNLDVLEAEAIRRSTPGSPLYQKWLTSDEVNW